MSHAERLLPTDPPLALVLRRSARARRFTLRVSRSDGRVVLTLPMDAREAEGLAFAVSRAGWIRSVQAGAGSRQRVGFGAALPVDGVALTVTPAAVKVPRIEGAALLVPSAADPGRLLATWLRHRARARLAAASAHYAARLGRQVGGIVLRDTRSRWGSCSATGRLMFSWRLMMAPPAVADYVAAHEVAHLAQMNHSPAFWAEVRALMPGYAAHRAWLRRHGPSLQAWDFA